MASPGEELFLQHLGFVPNYFRAQATTPSHFESQAVYFATFLFGPGALSRVQKERLLLSLAHANRSVYWATVHSHLLTLQGETTQENASDPLTEYACKVAHEGPHVAEGDVAGLRTAGWSEEAILEAALAAGLSRFLCTVAEGLHVVPDFPAVELHAPRPVTKIVHLEEAETRQIAEGPVPDPDSPLVDRVRQGDLTAFEALMIRHNQRVYRTLVGILGNPEDASDALQDTFLKAFEHLARFEGRAKFSTWLVSIATNAGLQRLRERRPMDSLDDTGEDEEFRPREIRAWGDNPEQHTSKAERRALVEQSVRRLPAKYRVVVMLRDIEQLSTEETAAALGLTVAATKARLIRGRLMLREALAPHFAIAIGGAA